MRAERGGMWALPADGAPGRRPSRSGGDRVSMFRWYPRPEGEAHSTTPPPVAHAPPSLRSGAPILELDTRVFSAAPRTKTNVRGALRARQVKDAASRCDKSASFAARLLDRRVPLPPAERSLAAREPERARAAGLSGHCVKIALSGRASVVAKQRSCCVLQSSPDIPAPAVRATR
jgi:hypothetical protein